MSVSGRRTERDDPAPLSEPSAQWLCQRARASLRRAAGGPAAGPISFPDDPRLREPARLFVSWHLGPRLVGCIGTLSGASSLAAGVERYAELAGLHDRRTANPSAEEIERLGLEIHLLGEPRPLLDTEGERIQGFSRIAAALDPGRDGVLLEHPDGRSAFFLPSVWSSLPEPATFLEALARKAGIDPHGEGARLIASILGATTIEDPP